LPPFRPSPIPYKSSSPRGARGQCARVCNKTLAHLTAAARPPRRLLLLAHAHVPSACFSAGLSILLAAGLPTSAPASALHASTAQDDRYARRASVLTLRAPGTPMVLIPPGRFRMGSTRGEALLSLEACRREPLGHDCSEELVSNETTTKIATSRGRPLIQRGPPYESHRAVRGGSYAVGLPWLRAAARMFRAASARHPYLGFRCALHAGPQPHQSKAP
jgi:formylglycine-generating enzyme required for sulfatase activity